MLDVAKIGDDLTLLDKWIYIKCVLDSALAHAKVQLIECVVP